MDKEREEQEGQVVADEATGCEQAGTREEQVKKAVGFFNGLLTGWGVPANWARVIAGALAGALLALAASQVTGCTMSYSKAADGSVEYNSAFSPAAVIKRADGSVEYGGSYVPVIKQEK